MAQSQGGKAVSDTPRTDCAWKPDGGDGYPTVDVDLARQLERELNAANERIKMLEEDLIDAKNQYAVLAADVVLYEDRGERIKRLEEAGDALLRDNDDMENINRWHKAKDAQ
jgi:hypothetical protein